MNWRFILSDLLYYLRLLVEKASQAAKCEWAKLRRDAAGAADFCGTCPYCAAVRAALKAAVFAAVAWLSPVAAFALLALYFFLVG